MKLLYNIKHDADNIEREKRKRNVVFSRVPESSMQSAEARTNSDLRKVIKLVNPEEDGLIVSCHRAGKKVEDRPRLLIVTLENPSLAQTLHCYGAGRKFTTTSGAEIWCNPDLIKSDRIANFHARKLLREKRQEVNAKKTRNS